MTKEQILDKLKQSIVGCNVEDAKEAAKEILQVGIDPMEAIEKASEGLRIVGEKFERCEMFIPHLVIAGDAMAAATEILMNVIPKDRLKTLGKIVLGTVEGDIHDIGKNIVASMLKVEGFEVYDIGKDIPIERFIEKANEVEAGIIGASALMTTTRPAQRGLLEELNRRGLRGKFRVMIGGGAVTQEWADKIGTDGYGKDARIAVKVARKLLSKE